VFRHRRDTVRGWGRRLLTRIDRERQIIETLQRAFRTGWDQLPRSRIGTAYISATRDASVGGDLFDIRRLDRDRGLLVVADVSGKGIEAAVNTAFVKYSIRTLALAHQDPAEILAAFNRMFLETIKDPGLFVVAFVGIFDARSLRLTYASAGHAGAFLRRDGHVQLLDVTGPIVGLDRAFVYETRTLDLEPRDLLVLATDGLTEARDRNGKVLDETGAMLLLEKTSTDPQACADELVSEVRRRSGGRITDDLALLVVEIEEKISPSAEAPQHEAA
jgi:serine phosphatase RsbU (regulator of sigma subunit)